MVYLFEGFCGFIMILCCIIVTKILWDKALNVWYVDFSDACDGPHVCIRMEDSIKYEEV